MIKDMIAFSMIFVIVFTLCIVGGSFIYGSFDWITSQSTNHFYGRYMALVITIFFTGLTFYIKKEIV